MAGQAQPVRLITRLHAQELGGRSDMRIVTRGALEPVGAANLMGMGNFLQISFVAVTAVAFAAVSVAVL